MSVREEHREQGGPWGWSGGFGKLSVWFSSTRREAVVSEEFSDIFIFSFKLFMPTFFL